MTERDLLLLRLRQVAGRLHGRTMRMGFLVGLSLTAGCAACLLFVSKLTPIPHAPAIGWATIAFGALAGLLLAPRPGIREAAVQADLAAGTEEVLSTAMETDDATPFGAATLSQAAGLVRSRTARSMTASATFRPPGILFVPVALFAILLFLPGLPAPAAERETAQLPTDRLRRLERDAKEIKKLSVEIENKDLRQLSQEMNRLVNDVQQGKLDKKEALAQIAKLAEKAEGIRKELDAQQKALAELGKNPETRSMAEALARGDLDAAKKEAGELAKQLASGALSADAKGALQEALSKMGAEAKNSGDGKLGDSARQAGEALQKGDAGEFGDRMSKLAESMKSARAGKGRSGRDSKDPAGGNPGDEKREGAGSELDDATADLGDAKEDLSEGEERSTAKGGSHCESCGRRKRDGNCPGGNCPGSKSEGSPSGTPGNEPGGSNQGGRRDGSSGTTNLGKEKSGPAGRDAHEDDPGPGSFGESEYSRLYAPQKTEGAEFEDLLSNRQLGDGPMLSKKLVRGRPDARAGSAVPYKQALPAYREAFEKAMNEGAIPPEYRDPVKKYFDTLNK